MKRRIDIDIDPQRPCIRAVVDRNRDILDRPERKIVRNRPVSAEAEPVVEPHDVDAEPEQSPVIAIRARNPAQLRQLKVLMLEHIANTNRSLCNQFPHRHVLPHRNAERQHVGNHAGHVARDVVSHRDRQADHDVLRALHSVQQDRAGRDQKPRQIGTGARGCGAERHDVPLRQFHGGAEKVRGVSRRTFAKREASGLGPIVQRLEPVAPICRGTIRYPVGHVIIEQSRERPEAATRRCLIKHKLRVDSPPSGGRRATSRSRP